ncbi:hypothetical protein [Terriglobus roseus]|nr:hypothetical protein [Terriglobus roseus]
MDTPACTYRPPRPRLVLRMGITGHRPTARRPMDVAAIEQALFRVMSVADELLPSIEGTAYDLAHPPRLTLISALAAGADQIAAHVFRSLPIRDDRARQFEVILPFPINAYAETMDDPADAETMRTLCKGADKCLQLADFLPLPGDTKDSIAQSRQNRRYETVGKLVVHQSDVLLAVWNGLPSEGVGGTGDVVLHAIRHGVPVVWIHPDGICSIIPVGTIRGDAFQWVASNAVTFADSVLEKLLRDALCPPPVDVESGAEEAETTPHYTLQEYLLEDERTLRLNWSFYNFLLAAPAGRRANLQNVRRIRGPVGWWTDARDSWRMPSDYVRRSLSADWKGFPGTKSSEEQLHFGIAWSSADAIATGLGHVYRSAYILVLALSFFAVAFGLAGIVLHEYKPWFVGTELTVLFAALYLYHHGRDKGLHERWLQTREVAELLRAAWAPMMIGGGGRRLARDGKHHWSAWLSNAYMAEAGLPSLNLTPNVLAQIAEAALHGIAEDQERYHTKNNLVLRSIHHRLESIGRGSLTLAIVNSLMLLVLLILFHLLPERLGDVECHQRLILGMAAASAALPTLGATVAALRFQGDFERFGRRSEQTSGQLRQVCEQLRAFILAIQNEETSNNAHLPRFESLLELFSLLETALVADLDDWRFVYITRTMPEPS